MVRTLAPLYVMGILMDSPHKINLDNGTHSCILSVDLNDVYMNTSINNLLNEIENNNTGSERYNESILNITNGVDRDCQELRYNGFSNFVVFCVLVGCCCCCCYLNGPERTKRWNNDRNQLY